MVYESDNGALILYQGEPLASSGEDEVQAHDAEIDEDGLNASELAARYEG